MEASSNNENASITEYNKIIRNRKLKSNDNIFQHNTWDDVEWDEEQTKEAQAMVELNSKVALSSEKIDEYENQANGFWDSFYNVHNNRFFKDRSWLYSEFSEIYEKESSMKDKKLIFEVGCGVGNTVFPILQSSKSDTFVYCCDFSSVAINIVKENPLYNSDSCHAFVCDITSIKDMPIKPNSLDVIILIFVLSAINPEKMQTAINSLSSLLKPGGVILFRDYGLYDLAQLRFKPGRCISDQFYARGDGTRVYFFTQEQVHDLFTAAGLEKVQNIVDRRLQVNRGKQLKMYRVWLQAKYRKKLSDE